MPFCSPVLYALLLVVRILFAAFFYRDDVAVFCHRIFRFIFVHACIYMRMQTVKYSPLQRTTIIISCLCVGIFGLVSPFNKSVIIHRIHAIQVFLVDVCMCCLSIQLSECFDFLFMFLWSCYNIFNSSSSLWNFGWRRRREKENMHTQRRMIPNA